MKSWKNEPLTKLQLNKIQELMGKQKTYRLTIDLEKTSKYQAHYLINALLNNNLQKLIQKGVLVLVDNSASKKGPTPTQKTLKYRVSGGEDLWSYTEFRTAVNGKLHDYKTDGKNILYQIIEVDQKISPLMIKNYDLTVEIVDE